MKQNIYYLILIILLTAAISACQSNQSEDSSKIGETDKTVAHSSDNKVVELLASMNMHYFTEPVKAPEFELASVKGGKVSLSQYRGNVILLSFWATW